MSLKVLILRRDCELISETSSCGEWCMIWNCSLTDWTRVLWSFISSPPTHTHTHHTTPAHLVLLPDTIWPLTNTSIHYPDDTHGLSIPAEHVKVDFSGDSMKERLWILLVSAPSVWWGRYSGISSLSGKQ